MMRAPTNYAGPRRKVKKPKQVSQSIQTNLATTTPDVRQILKAKGDLVLSVSRTDSVQTAICTLYEKRIGALIVLDEAGEIEGILSERDIVRRLADLGQDLAETRVEEIMTREVKTCSPEETLERVLHTMTQGRFRHMPVIDNEKLVGIVTIGDVVKHRLNKLELEALEMKQIIVG
ncbi:MAG: CBS domain-containing protein [Pseudomonadota bacterium]